MSAHASPHRRRGITTTAVVTFIEEYCLLVPLGAAIALVWANTGSESYYTVAHRWSFAVNEIGMALFFGLLTQEVVDAVMPGGALHTWRKWVLPAIAAGGGVAGSALVYRTYVALKYESVLALGWPAATAVDLAFAYFVARIIFRGHPASAFLLLVALATNLFGLIIVTLRYPIHDWFPSGPGGAALVLAAIALAALLRRWKVRSFIPYLAVCGTLSWWGLYLDGLHPAVALIPIVPFLPHAARQIDLFTDRDAGHRSPRHAEHLWNYGVQVVLFLFGLVNAGVVTTGYGTATWAVLTAAMVGRPVGILAAFAGARAVGFHAPAGFHRRDLVVVALAASCSFTFGLFFATAIYPPGAILGELKMGAFATGAGTIAALLAARGLGVGRFTHHRGSPHLKKHDHEHLQHARA